MYTCLKNGELARIRSSKLSSVKKIVEILDEVDDENDWGADDDDDEKRGECKRSVCRWSVKSETEAAKRTMTMSLTIVVGAVTRNGEYRRTRSPVTIKRKMVVCFSREMSKET